MNALSFELTIFGEPVFCQECRVASRHAFDGARRPPIDRSVAQERIRR